MLDSIHLTLLRASDGRHYDTTGKMMPGIRSRIGTPMKFVRAAAKDLVSAGPDKVLECAQEFLEDARKRRGRCEPVAQEVFWTVLLAVAQTKLDFAAKLDSVNRLGAWIDNWAACDLFGEALKDFANPEHFGLGIDFIRRQIESGDLWRVRLGLVILLKNVAPASPTGCKRAVELSLLRESCECARNHYYGSMALAWAFSVYVVCDFDFTCAELFKAYGDGRVDPVTLRRTAQKVRDSFRVSEANKRKMSDNVAAALASVPSGTMKTFGNYRLDPSVPSAQRRHSS